MAHDLNRIFGLVRTGVFGVVSLFALIAIILAALVTNFASTHFFSHFGFAALGIATGILTILTLPVMWFLSVKRKGAITSMTVFEIAWTWFLWIMWVSVGGSTVNTFWFVGCEDASSLITGDLETACRSTQGLAAFGFLNWIALLFFNIFLLTLAIRQHMRGHTGIWTSYVTEVDFTAPSVSGASGFSGYPAQSVEAKPANFAPQYPPPTSTPSTAYSGQPVAQNPSYPQV
ncbi:unnamed protein product [Cyclocybe aegerita]|uniref:MARVEL domain-containing protein n=1 Tax=Cyclocybe aegerita TaxID=1973307 RepID=A0A8S0X119_CYCAE|nr:unnamed protein product [Cyclocybe aegerita]